MFNPKTATADVRAQATLDFLTKYQDLWHLKDPAKELRRRSAGRVMVEFNQWNGGVPVFEAGFQIMFDDGVPVSAHSYYVPDLDAPDKPAKLSGAQAIEIARKHEAVSQNLVPPQGSRLQ